MCLGWLGWQEDKIDIHIGGLANAAKTSQTSKSKKKSLDSLDFETMSEVSTTRRSFYANCVKCTKIVGSKLSPRWYRGLVSSVAKSVISLQ